MVVTVVESTHVSRDILSPGQSVLARYTCGGNGKTRYRWLSYRLVSRRWVTRVWRIGADRAFGLTRLCLRYLSVFSIGLLLNSEMTSTMVRLKLNKFSIRFGYLDHLLTLYFIVIGRVLMHFANPDICITTARVGSLLIVVPSNIMNLSGNWLNIFGLCIIICNYFYSDTFFALYKCEPTTLIVMLIIRKTNDTYL